MSEALVIISAFFSRKQHRMFVLESNSKADPKTVNIADPVKNRLKMGELSGLSPTPRKAADTFDCRLLAPKSKARGSVLTRAPVCKFTESEP